MRLESHILCLISFLIFISFVVTIILATHVRKLHTMGVGGNRNLCISVVLSNVIRTVILSILNLVCTVYFITANEDPTNVLMVWPINNIFFIALIGYDTNIINSTKQIRSPMFQSRPQGCASNNDHRGSLSTMFSEPVLISNTNSNIKNTAQQQSRLRRASSLVLREEDDLDGLAKSSEIISGEGESNSTSTILDMTTNDDEDSPTSTLPGRPSSW